MWHARLEAVFQALTESQVRWCLLRPPVNPEAPTGDIDLLIDTLDLRRAEPILEALEFVEFPTGGSGEEHVYLSYHPPTNLWLWLHVVTDLSFGRHLVQTRAGAGCLDRRQRDGSTFILGEEDAFWTTLLHCLLDKKAIAPRHQCRLQEWVGAARTDSPLAAIVEKACPAGWSAERLVTCVRQGDWSLLESMAPPMLAAWMKQQPIAQRILRSCRKGARLPVKVWQRLRRRGLSVALLGPDGAGKSTLAASVQHWFFSPVRLIYMGSGSGDGRPLLVRVRLPGVGSPGRLLILWWRFLTSIYHKLMGRLVIFDRYTYDALLPHGERPPWTYRLSRWFHARSCPAPDLVLVLDAPGELMYERKKEQSPAILEKQRQRFLDLRSWLPGVQVVDATRREEAVRSDVLERIWKQYAARWRKS